MWQKLQTGMGLVGLCVQLYLIAYLALVRQGVRFQSAGYWTACPDYRGLPAVAETCFAPLHNWDRTSLRLRMWQGRKSEAEQRAQARAIVDFLELMKQP
jgi:hypothetical protein